MSKFGELKFGEKEWGYDLIPSELSHYNFYLLEKILNRNPYLKFRVCWGGNWARAINLVGNFVSTINSSSETSGYPDDRVIDGKRPHRDPNNPTENGFWQSSGTTMPEWVKVDLSVARIVNRIILYFHYDTDYVADSFKIQYSNYDSTWTDIYQEINNIDTKKVIELSTDISARYWRIYITKIKTSNYPARIQEFELYNATDESSRIVFKNNEPDININKKLQQDVTSTPDETDWTITLSNRDKRFTPLNNTSAIYGSSKADKLGDIRSEVPVIIEGGFYDENNILRFKEILSGQIGLDNNSESSIGISLNTDDETVTIQGKDFVHRIKSTPIDLIPVYESYSIENLMRELGYLANIPYQDMDMEATGINLSYAIFEATTVYDNLEK